MGDKKKRFLIAITVISILIIATIFLIFGSKITGKSILEKYTYTKAICNKTNYCEDFEIECNGQEITKMQPTGAAIQQSGNWSDPRDEEIINNICD